MDDSVRYSVHHLQRSQQQASHPVKRLDLQAAQPLQESFPEALEALKELELLRLLVATSYPQVDSQILLDSETELLATLLRLSRPVSRHRKRSVHRKPYQAVSQ